MRQKKESLFDGPGQHVQATADQIRLATDRALIRDLQEEELKIGSIWIPETVDKAKGVGKQGQLRIGVVVKIGPGDHFIEINESGVASRAFGAGVKRIPIIDEYGVSCTVAPQVGEGERVLYQTMNHERVFFDDAGWFLVHAEQAIWGVYGRCRHEDHFNCLYDKILVRPDPTETLSPSGLLVIPGNSQEDTRTGTVVSAGPGRQLTPDGTRVPLDVVVGDRIMWENGAGDEVRIGRHNHADASGSHDKETLLIMSERSVIGVVG